MTIDAHHHFWRYTEKEYGWIDDSMSVIRRDFLPADLQAEIGAEGIDGAISVQARQTLEETAWLLKLAGANELIKAVVGWVPLVSRNVADELARFAASPKFRAVRHVLQGGPDEAYMLRDDFNEGVRALRQFNLAYDILIFERQLPQTIEFVDGHPSQIFVLDHIAKPRIKDRLFEPWNRNIRELAKRENVFCKVSGMVTEADWRTWTEDHLRPYFDTALEAFGAERLMFGSDWPVCLVSSPYRRWHELAHRFAASLTEAEKVDLFGGTASRAYSIPSSVALIKEL